MRKVFFLALSDILLDHCDNCRGFWLDGGEFKRINQELGGLKSIGGGDFNTNSPAQVVFSAILDPAGWFNLFST